MIGLHAGPRLSAFSDLTIRAHKINDIPADVEATWHALCGTDQSYASPYFHIEFTRCVARVRDDVEVAVIRSRDGLVRGILPYQRTTKLVADPVGGRLNDVHGALGLESSAGLFQAVMRACELKLFRFHALANPTRDCGNFEFVRRPSYYIDLKPGWEPYHRWLLQHSSTIQRHPQKSRALDRLGPPIRFEFRCQESSVLEQLIQMKRAKYQRTRTFDILSVDWAANLLRAVHRSSIDGFGGQLSALWAGDELVAAHFGMVNGNELHYWFPVYNPKFAKYSPGTELILNIAREAANSGFTKIDFGYGDENFKLKFCDGRADVSCGLIAFNRASFLIAKQRFHLRNQLKRIPMKPVAKTLLRGVFPQFGEWNYR